MFGKRCSLCGGKLNSRGICTECGLDNSKSDKNYRINRSDCDGMPLTHVHEEKEKYRPDRKADHREKTEKACADSGYYKPEKTIENSDSGNYRDYSFG